MKILRELPLNRRIDPYPWNLWADGQKREAERGKDYSCSDLSFGSAVRNYARRHKLRVTCWRTPAGVGFVFFRQNPAPVGLDDAKFSADPATAAAAQAVADQDDELDLPQPAAGRVPLQVGIQVGTADLGKPGPY